MNGRSDFAVRSLVGPWLALPLVAFEVVNLMQRGAPWRGDALWTVDWMAIVLFIAGPLATGVAAVDAARLTRPGAVHLVVTSARPRLAFVRAMLWCALPLVAVHTLTLVAALMFSRPPMADLLRTDLWLGFVAQLLAFVWYAALGSLLGRFVTPLLAGLAGVVTALLAFHLLSGAPRGEPGFDLLWVGGATVSRIGVEWSYEYLLVQLALLGVTAALFVTAPVRVRAGRALPSFAGAGLVVVGVAVITGAAMTGPAPRNIAGDPQPPTLCFDGVTTICFNEQHRRWVKPVAEQVMAFAGAARDAGYDVLVPDLIHQTNFSYAPEDPDTRAISLDIEYLARSGGRLEAEILVGDLVEPFHCPQLFAEEAPPDAYFENMSLLKSTWWAIADGLIDEEERWIYEGEPTLEPDEAAVVMTAFRSCDLDHPA